MSMFGDDREHMNEWNRMLEERVEQVGLNQTMAEVHEVLNAFFQYLPSDK